MKRNINDDFEELSRVAAQLYKMVEDHEGIGDCIEPSGNDNACPPSGCADCGWYASELRDSLLRLGVNI